LRLFFDDDKVKEFYRDGIFSIKPQSVTFTGNNMVDITRQMIPLTVCYEKTYYKKTGEINVRKVDQKAYEELCRIQNGEFSVHGFLLLYPCYKPISTIQIISINI